MVQWWQHSPPTNVARVRHPVLVSYVGWAVCCWSRPCSEGFFPVSPVFLPSHKPTFPNSIWNQWTKGHSVEMPLQNSNFIYLFIDLFNIYFYYYFFLISPFRRFSFGMGRGDFTDSRGCPPLHNIKRIKAMTKKRGVWRLRPKALQMRLKKMRRWNLVTGKFRHDSDSRHLGSVVLDLLTSSSTHLRENCSEQFFHCLKNLWMMRRVIC